MLDGNIEDLVRQYVAFRGHNSKGWNTTYCEVCGDGSRTKGPRGGWLFTDDLCFYHCFNCNIDGNFDPDREHPFSKDMRKIFNGFGIPENEYYAIAYKKKILDGNKTVSKPERRKVEISTLPVPDYFYKLSDAKPGNIIAEKAIAELKHRNIDPSSYTFYLSNGITKGGPKEEAIAKALMNRLIIPYFNPKGEMIYYQARSFDKNAIKKYINPDVPRTNIIYGMDRLYENADLPLFVTEGFFDAFHLRGVSIQENSLTSGQIEILKKSPRKKVFVPDKKSDSTKVVDQFIKLGWYVTVPDIGSSCKDIDDAIRNYGKLYVFQEVNSNIHEASVAKIFMGLKGFIYK